jgi:hypothetical protein
MPALEALRALVAALGADFSQYGPCCFVLDPDRTDGACGEPAHVIEFRPGGGLLFYCDDHGELRPDPRLTQQLPHAPALRKAQRVLKEVNDE